MKTPAFWYGDDGSSLGRWLAPIGAVYGRAAGWRIATTTPVDAGVPVICVGNLVAGGAGKTPVAIDLLRRLRQMGVDAHALTRGHGGSLRGPVMVDTAQHIAREVGDEPLLLSHVAPCWVARDRAAGARAAVAAGARAIVLDDGHQNPALRKRLSLIVVDGAVGFGNGRLIPAGPLREPVAAGLGRAHAVVLLGEDRTGVSQAFGDLPVFEASLVPHPDAAALSGRAVFAFAGIGRPEKFFQTLYGIGARVVARRPFADHHPYTTAELDEILADADRQKAIPVTTAKDWVRLPADRRDRFAVVRIELAWRDPERVERMLARAVAR